MVNKSLTILYNILDLPNVRTMINNEFKKGNRRSGTVVLCLIGDDELRVKYVTWKKLPKLFGAMGEEMVQNKTFYGKEVTTRVCLVAYDTNPNSREVVRKGYDIAFF